MNDPRYAWKPGDLERRDPPKPPSKRLSREAKLRREIRLRELARRR